MRQLVFLLLLVTVGFTLPPRPIPKKRLVPHRALAGQLMFAPALPVVPAKTNLLVEWYPVSNVMGCMLQFTTNFQTWTNVKPIDISKTNTVLTNWLRLYPTQGFFRLDFPYR